MEINYRYAEKNEKDAYDIEYVSAHSWYETYQGIMPQEYLESRVANIDKNKSRTLNFLKKVDTYFVAEVDGKVVGICYYDNFKNDKYKDYGYLGAIYLLEEYQSLGIGKEMFKIAVENLIKMGYEKMYLECAVGNKHLGFYEYYFGNIVDTIDYKISDFSIKADILVFEDLHKVLEKINKKKIK